MGDKRVALVTGGSRGIGFGVALCLAKNGFDIVICGRRPQIEVEDALQELRSTGADVLYCIADVSSADDRTAMLDAIKNKFGALHVLVNNAGIAPKVRADMLDADEESFALLLKTNLQGPYFLTQAAAKWMIEQQKADDGFHGCVVNVSSVSSTVASTNRGDYCISKAGISMATTLWAARLGEFNIPVYEVRPGVIKTDMTSGVTGKYDKLIEDGLCLLKRWGFPEDIGKAVAMLARGDLAYSTGQVILVDGGMTIQSL